jgi:hypothetical protein
LEQPACGPWHKTQTQGWNKGAGDQSLIAMTRPRPGAVSFPARPASRLSSSRLYHCPLARTRTRTRYDLRLHGEEPAMAFSSQCGKCCSKTLPCDIVTILSNHIYDSVPSCPVLSHPIPSPTRCNRRRRTWPAQPPATRPPYPTLCKTRHGRLTTSLSRPHSSISSLSFHGVHHEPRCY